MKSTRRGYCGGALHRPATEQSLDFAGVLALGGNDSYHRFRTMIQFRIGDRYEQILSVVAHLPKFLDRGAILSDLPF